MSEALHGIGGTPLAEAQRDAIHVAVVPLTAGCELNAGQHVGTVNGEAFPVDKTIGIVDPYRKQPARKGDRIWVFLYPGSIIGLRHHWDHHDFPSSELSKQAAQDWIHDFARSWSMDPWELIDKASSMPSDEWGNYIVAKGVDLHSASELGEDEHKFWRCLEVITGKTFDGAHRAKFGWSCSC